MAPVPLLSLLAQNTPINLMIKAEGNVANISSITKTQYFHISLLNLCVSQMSLCNYFPSKQESYSVSLGILAITGVLLKYECVHLIERAE